MRYHKNNFYRNTFAVFQKKSPENIDQIHYVSKHGSKYIFTPAGVFRYSNHWGRVGNCRWRLEALSHKQQVFYWGFARWQDFYSNDETSQLYFIEKTSRGDFIINHKENAIENQTVFFSAKEAAKRIKKINEIQEGDFWFKYVVGYEQEEARKILIYELMCTKNTYFEIMKRLK